MCGIRMSQSMDTDLLVYVGFFHGLLEYGLRAWCAVPASILSFEQVFGRSVFLEVFAELVQEAFGQVDIME